MLNGPLNILSFPGKLFLASKFWRLFDINKEIAHWFVVKNKSKPKLGVKLTSSEDHVL